LDAINEVGAKYNVFTSWDNDDNKIRGRYFAKPTNIMVNVNDYTSTGISVKFVTANYNDREDKIFANILGETANFRSAGVPYFQVLIFPDKIPHFDRHDRLMEWNYVNERTFKKYVLLSGDNIYTFKHIPNLTLVCVVEMPLVKVPIIDRRQYHDYFLKNDFNLRFAMHSVDFAQNAIYNDYELFILRTAYIIVGLIGNYHKNRYDIDSKKS